MLLSDFTKLLFSVTLLFSASQTYASYSSVKRMTAEYSSLKHYIDDSQINIMSLNIVLNAAFFFRVIFVMCVF